jgi:2-polyprenyl-3-methyl-5-hydroxy-6-metoxy-1,4-benzoquinol methylase
LSDELQDKQKIVEYYDAEAPSYQKQYDPELVYSNEEYPANYFRLKLILQRLSDIGARSVLDVGSGDAIPMISMIKSGLEVVGLDYSPGMVEKARENLANTGLKGNQVHMADFENSTALDNIIQGKKFDAVVAAGVFPHSNDESHFLESARQALKPNGVLFLEFRNKLFSLFTMNRLTRDFFLNDLLFDLDADIKSRVTTELNSRLAVEQPPLRLTGANELAPGYDAITAKFHNPFELTSQLKNIGFDPQGIHWYHFHPAPPWLEGTFPDLFRKAAVELENPGDWRGHFLCSAGVIEARVI